MVRVIKGQKGSDSKPPIRFVAQKNQAGARVIERETYQARQQAALILKDGENQKKHRLAQGRQAIAKVREEVMASAAREAFAGIVQSVLRLFLERVNQYQSYDGVMVPIVQEVVQKVLGTLPKIDPEELKDRIAEKIKQVRLRRHVDLLISKGALEQLKKTHSDLFRYLENIPEIRFVEDEEIKSGFVRMALDIGHVMCEQDPIVQFLKEQSHS